MQHYLNYITEQLKILTSIPSPSGFTHQVTSYVHSVLTELGYEPTFSKKGNVLVTIGGEGNPLVLAAHLDTLGAMVRSIKENGRLRPTTIGGHQWFTCDGENCTVHTRDGKIFTGVILNHEPSAHVSDDPAHTNLKESDMEILLDENVFSKEDTKKLGIQIGDFIALDPRTVITETGYIKSRYLDDKLSAAILLGIAKFVKDNQITLKRKVTLMFTTYEEVGHGAAVIPPDTEEMISVDMGCVGADLECTEQQVSICAKDSRSPYNYEVTSALISTAKAANIDFAIDVYPHYASDVDMALVSGNDILHGLIGPGVYASHNYERAHINGVKNTFLLIQSYIC